MSDRGELVSHENQRLRAEVTSLKSRLAAIEGSRWWRMNPRRLATGAVRQVSSTRRASNGRHETTAEQTAATSSELAARFDAEVVARGAFTETWFTENIDSWEPICAELDGRPSHILEIGSLEGLSASYLLWRLPQARLTCIDTFAGSPELESTSIDFDRVEKVFDANVALVDSERVRKLVGDSRMMLLDVELHGATFDLVFVDGSHHGLDVIVDAALSWRLVADGGIVIFDDYSWAWPGTDRVERPGPAIDAFLSLIDGTYELLFKDDQVAVRKKAA
jgi:hypothetical protein